MLETGAAVRDYAGEVSEGAAAARWTSACDPLDRRRAAARAEHAFAPFSKFQVGAAIEDAAGRIHTGCNVENATYGLTVCAERVAVFKAISEGVRQFRRVAVAADTDVLTPPCGACRQILWEFCGDVEIVLVNLRGKTETYRLKDLFPSLRCFVSVASSCSPLRLSPPNRPTGSGARATSSPRTRSIASSKTAPWPSAASASWPSAREPTSTRASSPRSAWTAPTPSSRPA